MKKFWLLAVWCAVLMLAGCNSNCNCNCNVDNDCNTQNEYKQFCLDNWWTYNQVSAPDEEYWECSFPSWIGCRDDILMTDECNFIPDTSNIDTEEERLAGCEENAQWWVLDFENWENISIDWEDEEEGGASFVRNWVVHYTKNWENWKIGVECVADFVDWSISASFGESELE